MGLGQAYSQSLDFAEFFRTEFFRKINKDLPGFLTKAIEYYCTHKR